MTKRPEPVLFLDDHRGIYIPRDFAQCIRRECISGIEPSDLDFLATELDADHYWDVWQEVCDRAVIIDQGTTWHLYQDGALWLIPEGMEWSESDDWYVWPGDDSTSQDGDSSSQ